MSAEQGLHLVIILGSQQYVHQCRFPGTTFAQDGNVLTGLDIHRKIIKYQGRISSIAKGHIVDFKCRITGYYSGR